MRCNQTEYGIGRSEDSKEKTFNILTKWVKWNRNHCSVVAFFARDFKWNGIVYVHSRKKWTKFVIKSQQKMKSNQKIHHFCDVWVAVEWITWILSVSRALSLFHEFIHASLSHPKVTMIQYYSRRYFFSPKVSHAK